MRETIFAQATVPGKSGVAIIRISGPRAVAGCASLTGSVPPPHRAALRRIGRGERALDSGLVIHFPSGASFTGEDVVELQLHGSIAVCRAVLDALAQIEGFRPAEAGEFTRRALENEALDLTQVEGLADLIEAETEAQRLQAQRVFDGELSRRVTLWRGNLTEAAALVEATIDFADEEVPVDVLPDVIARLETVAADLDRDLSAAGAAERIRSGFEIAITGRPNVGKSTLLNALAKRQAALTSDIAGTTRDVIEVQMDLGGYPVTLIDTAGLRETTDPLEAAGISLARERAARADLRLQLVGPGDSPGTAENSDLVVYTHADQRVRGPLSVSGTTGFGLTDLVAEIGARLDAMTPKDTLVIRRRQADALRSARQQIAVALEGVGTGIPSELLAEEIALASAALAPIIGRIDAEDLLGEIFSRFCIGK